MRIYKLTKADTGEEVKSREDILNIVVGDAIVDLRDGYCICYRCDREYDLSNDDELRELKKTKDITKPATKTSH